MIGASLLVADDGGHVCPLVTSGHVVGPDEDHKR